MKYVRGSRVGLKLTMRMQVFQLLGIFLTQNGHGIEFFPKSIYFIRLSNLMFQPKQSAEFITWVIKYLDEWKTIFEPSENLLSTTFNHSEVAFGGNAHQKDLNICLLIPQGYRIFSADRDSSGQSHTI